MTVGAQCVAAIDCGTNAVRLLVADIDTDGRLHERARLMRIVRLGEGVDRTGEFSEAALLRTFEALDEYAQVMSEHDVARTRFVATSASRDVSNREAFAAGVLARIGVPADVITGEEEAALSFSGALRGLPAGLASMPSLVMDIGGGSLELSSGVDEEPDISSLALQSLMKCAPDRSLEFVKRYLRGDEPDMVSGAAMAIGEARLPDSFAILRGAMEGPGARHNRYAFYLPLALTREPEAFEVLLEALCEERRHEALAAVKALAVFFGDPERVARVEAVVSARGERDLVELFERLRDGDL